MVQAILGLILIILFLGLLIAAVGKILFGNGAS